MTIEARAQRGILFRGKTVCKNEWCFGYYVNFDEVDYIFLLDTGDECDGSNENVEIELCPANSMIEVIPETVGQYTGLNDKNGVKIFEGDVVKDRIMGKSGVIIFNNGSFVIEGMNKFETPIMIADDYIVLGNIHDNPELLLEGGG